MKLIALPSGLIINLEAVAFIRSTSIRRAASGAKEGGIEVVYQAMTTPGRASQPARTRLSGENAKAFLAELDQMDVLTGHLREAMKKEELPDEEEEAEEEESEE